MTADPPRYHPDWLALREPADAAARSDALVAVLRRRMAAAPAVVIHDLGAGTGAMCRWLAGRLPGPQRWVLHDRDPDLLARAAAGLAGAHPVTSADGHPVQVAVRPGELTDLTAGDLRGASLVTASALLDLLTGAEVERIADACAQAGCPALLTLSVDGQVRLDPTDPLDGQLGAAFNDHQRRAAGRRRPLGPEAVGATTRAFVRAGLPVQQRASPWRLGADRSELIAQWLRGWVAAASEQRPALAGPAADYLARRLAAAAAGQLQVTVGHRDLLAAPA